jgi:hypothetical protein
MAGDSFSTGSSFSNSSSQSVPFEGPERGFLLNLAQYNEGLEQQMYNWAQQQFAGTSAVTDQAVGNFLNASQKAMGQADQMWDRYTNTFQPLENELVSDARSYAGAGRIASEMGRAGATVSQGMDQQRQAALRDLESYGIDPSAGRFAALDRAERLQGALPAPARRTRPGAPRRPPAASCAARPSRWVSATRSRSCSRWGSACRDLPAR